VRGRFSKLNDSRALPWHCQESSDYGNSSGEGADGGREGFKESWMAFPQKQVMMDGNF
jgi:hypothetical protein